MGIRISDETERRIERLAARLPGGTKSGLVRALVERSLDEIEADPAKLVKPEPPTAEGKEPGR